MTISEVSEKYEMTADTLRYYERIGLIPRVPRKSNGIRDYDETSCHWVSFIKCMRSAGVQIDALIEYVNLMQQAGSEEKRLTILKEQRDKLADKMKTLQATIERLNYKIDVYNQKLSKWNAN
ncbi:MAG: MerR family transcriptional regulator [Selenomonadaceae bacterium]|nr:MerR family transcriptional regulator [Selenomonadaceae bacterium]MBR1858242.1 MerR family transcriptional regulator [Selenomonadaceae bacterium]